MRWAKRCIEANEKLNDGSQDLLDTLTTGGLATYDVNGLGNTIHSNSRTVTLAPGLTVNLLQATPSGQPVTVPTEAADSVPVSSVASFDVGAMTELAVPPATYR